MLICANYYLEQNKPFGLGGLGLGGGLRALALACTDCR